MMISIHIRAGLGAMTGTSKCLGLRVSWIKLQFHTTRNRWISILSTYSLSLDYLGLD